MIGARTFGLLLLAACAQRDTPALDANASARIFTLACHAAATPTSATLHCVRTDTRDGDIRRIEIEKLPVSNGPTAAAAGPPGRYQTACAAAETDTRADFYCVRLDTMTGELLLVNLQKVGLIPDAK